MADKNVKEIVAAHDKLKVQVAKLQADLKDKAGDYERRIKDQKDRIYNLEVDLDDARDEIEKLKEVIVSLNLKLVDEEKENESYRKDRSRR